jgi:hypothetical protein
MNAEKIAKALRLLAEAIEDKPREEQPANIAPAPLDEVSRRRCLEAMRRKGLKV